MPTKNHPLPEPFKAWLRGSFLMTQRITAAQMRRLALLQLKHWREGDDAMAFPGYSSPPPNDFEAEYPAGWSQTAFDKLRREAKATTTLVRIGIRA